MLEIFRKLSGKAYHTVPKPKNSFNIAEGVSIFPEARCCFCEKILKCKRIWQIRNGYLIGWWDIDYNSLSRNQDLIGAHPHVNRISGLICMGNSPTAEGALFGGWNYDDSYWGAEDWDNWLQDVWDHDCWELERMEDD